MTEILTIRTRSLKDLLNLFNPEETFVRLSLGDTWHPSSGFIDEEILKGKNKVRELIEFDYNFEGLVGFQAGLGNVEVSLITHSDEDSDQQEYEILGTPIELRNLKNKANELNCYDENRYQVTTRKKW
jgi:hypothetical protein